MGLKLLIVRHAHAGDREEFSRTGKPDHLRPITETGVEQMVDVCRLLRAVLPECDLVMTSPYVRAVQTAEIVAKVWDARIREACSLEPDGSPEEFLTELSKSRAKVVAAVGHEPDLGILASWLTTKVKTGIELSKGGACLIEFEGKPAAGSGRLRWLISPKLLAKYRR